jgi:Arc/MetJ-type ribon-helix-helix transcriptional regulator
VSRQGIAFDYNSPAELYLSRRRGRHTDYRRFATAAEAIHYAVVELRTRRRRFATAAEAIHYAVVELRTRRSLNAWMQVGDKRFDEDEINRLYDEGDFPLRKSK